MWIKTQIRYCLINTDNADYICIDIPRKGIACKLKNSENTLVIATYNTPEECMKVFAGINTALFGGIPVLELPLGGDIDSWASNVDEASLKWIAAGRP